MSSHRKPGQARTGGVAAFAEGLALVDLVTGVSIAAMVVVLMVGQALAATGTISFAMAGAALLATFVLSLIALRSMPLWGDRAADRVAAFLAARRP